jgi:hypothetical protein
MYRSIKALIALSFAWNIYLVSGVVLGQSYALTRAAGGQFESFPAGIRFAYIFTLLVLIYQVLIFFTDIKRPTWIYKAFFFLGLSSVFVNAISRSADERWNVIPAAVIAWGFWKSWRSQKA